MCSLVIRSEKTQGFQQSVVLQQIETFVHSNVLQVFKEELGQFYVAFKGRKFALPKTKLKYYEDFLDCHLHNVVLEKPRQQHILTRVSFPRFLCQLFEVAKCKVDPKWKPKAVLWCGLDWTEGSPRHLQSLKDVPYSYDSIISEEESDGWQTDMESTDYETALEELSDNTNAFDDGSVGILRSEERSPLVEEEQVIGLAHLSKLDLFSDEEAEKTLLGHCVFMHECAYQVFLTEFHLFYITFKAMKLQLGKGFVFQYYEDAVECYKHNTALLEYSQRHILTDENFKKCLNALFCIARNKTDWKWQPTVAQRCKLTWQQGKPGYLKSLQHVPYNFDNWKDMKGEKNLSEDEDESDSEEEEESETESEEELQNEETESPEEEAQHDEEKTQESEEKEKQPNAKLENAVDLPVSPKADVVDELNNIEACENSDVEQVKPAKKSSNVTVGKEVANEAKPLIGQEPRTQPSNQRRVRKRRNPLIGWLCSKILKVFVKGKVLL